MRKTVILSVFAMFVMANSLPAQPANAKDAIDAAVKSGHYLFLVFYEKTDAAFTSISSTAKNFQNSSKTKISIYNAKLSEPENRETASKYGVKNNNDLPLMLIFAPNGVITGGFPTSVTSEQLKQSVSVSDLMLKILKSLQQQKIVLVALQNQTTKLNAESWQGVSDFVNDKNYNQFSSAVKADPAESGSLEFVKQCGLISPLSVATVIVLLPPGQIGKILNGKTSKSDIVAALQSCTSGSCGSGGCSDRRLKKNVTNIESALDKVQKLAGVSFTWDRDTYPRKFFPEGRQIGVIAQDVESVIPQIVHTDKDGYKTVEYDKLTALLIEAVKELKQKVQDQEKLIKEQDTRIKTLEGKK